VRDSGVSVSLGASEAFSAVSVAVTISLAFTEVLAGDVDVGKSVCVGKDTVIPAFSTTSTTSRSGGVSVSLVADKVASAVAAAVTISLAKMQVLAVDVVSVHRSGGDHGCAEGG